MSGEVCLIMTPKLEELYNKLQSKYPKECEASLVNKNVFLGWVELYQKDFNKTPDFTPDLKSLVPYVENLRKREGRSFLNKEIAQKSEANSTLVQFIKDIETLAGYYEGGGRVLSDDVPNFPNELDDKLNDYFMEGKELSLDDYRKLWKVLEFKDGKVYARKPTTTEDNKQDIVTQLIDQLKASGITVLGKADMEKYLTEKGKLDPVYTLQAIKENKEMQDIKAKALADGTFMKAPNGKPTNLTERQWLQVRTKAFKEWFGDWENDPTNASKVVDENGEPKVMFRTDGANKTVMGRGDEGSFFATDNLSVAGSYASKEASLYKGFVSLKNPYIIKGESHGFFFEYKGKETTVQEAQSSLIEEGYDGVYFERTWDVGDRVNVGKDYWANNVAMFNPNQFKSATDNNGEFSTENDDIQMFIGKKAYGNPLTRDLYYAENQYKKTIQQINSLERELNSNIYEDSISTKNGSIKIVQNERSKDSSEYDRDTITLSSGRSIFGRVSISIQANVSKNLIGGSILFPSIEINNPNNNYLRLENPIRSNHASLLKTVLQYFIDNGHNKPHTQWTLYAGGKYGKEYNYKGRIKNLSKVLGVDVSPYFQFEMRDGKEENTVEERVIVDAKGLIEALPTLVDTKAFSKLTDVLQSNEQNNVDYILKRKNLTQQLHELNKQRDVEWKKVQDIKKKIKNELDASSDLPFFITPEGEVYGFVDEKGNIYLDETVISPEHPIHEYTHLWDTILAKKNPALWNRGKQLLKDKNLKLKGHEKSIWQEIEEDPNYGLKWDKTKAHYEDYVASEVHARLTGKKGLQLLDEIAKQKGSKNIISKLKQWILDVYKELKATFSKWTPEELDKLTIKDFTYMTLRDFTSGMDLSNVPTILKETSDPNISKEQINEARNALYHIIQTSKFRIDQIQDKIKWNKATNEDIQNLNKYKVKLKEDTELLAGLDTGKSEVYINEYNTPMVRWVNKKEKPSSPAEQSLINSAVQKHQGNWSRQEAQNNPKILYVFTDNTDRDSGSGIIPADSWYSKKYGAGHHFPTMTAAVVRGLDNSRPISTQRWYHQGAKGTTGRWTDADIEEFKKVIREELQEIVNEFNTGKYDTIMFPDGDGLFNTRISAISKTRTPKLYQALGELLHEFGFDSLIPSDITISNSTAPTSTLNITPAKPVDKKAAAKGSISNKFIGFAEGIAGSSTAEYARQAGDKANVGSYNVNDVVFVSIPGLRGNEIVRHQQQDKTIAEALKALEAGATLVTDNKAYTQSSTYNEGEKKLAKALEKAGAVYSEKIVNNQTLGIWILPSTKNTGLNNITAYNSDNVVDKTPKPAIQKKEVKEISNPRSEAIKSALEISKNEDREYHEAFSPRQIADLGEYFGKVFSRKLDVIEGDRIDELNELLSDDSYTKKEKEEIRETLNKFEDPIKGRQLIAQEYGINNLINDVLKEVKGNIEDAEEYNNEDELVLWTNAKKYFTKIFNEQTTLNIEEAEGIRIVDLEVKENTTDDPNNDEDEDDDTSQYADKEASGWLYKARYTDPASTLSKKVKRLFSYIEKEVLVIDKDGNGKYVTEKNSIGMPKYYSTSQVYATFLSYFSNNVKNPDSFMYICKTYNELVEAIGEDEVKEWVAEDEEEFKEEYPYGYPLFPALEEMEKQYPWVKGIIGKLTNDFWKGNTYHTYGTLSSQMYSGLKLAFIPYDKYDKTAGRLRYLNHDMAEQVMLEKLKTNYYNGITLTNTSIYNSDGSINVEHLQELKENGYGHVDTGLKPLTTDASEEEIKIYNEVIKEYLNYIRSFGIDMNANAVVALVASERIGGFLRRLGYIQDVISKQIESGAKSADTFDYMVDVRHLKSDVNLWKDLFTGAGIITDDQYVQSFRDSATKKTKYSYSSDNYIMNTFRSIGMGSLEDRRAYIDEHYSKYEWFRNQKTGEWRNYWLDIFYNRGIDNLKGSVDEFLLPAYRNVDNVEDEKKGKPVVRKYSKWTAEDIFDIQQSGYDQKKNWAFYLAPIFSDSPMSLMVRGPKFTMKELIEKHKDQILKGNRLVDVDRRGAFVELVRQELVRIKYEVERQKAIKAGKILPIDNFDYGNALKFCFIPELNDYTINGKTLKEAIANAQKDLATDDEIDDIIREYVKEVLEPNFINYYSTNMKGFDDISDFKKDQLRVRYYNMVYANASMIQLLTVDLAFYKNFIDFQKRWKEVYSGGNKPNTSSRFGKKTENVAVLRDIIITSPSYSRVAAAVDRNQNLSKEDKEHIKGIFKNVNVADAQAIRSLKSFRAVMDMLGKWSLAHDKALENFSNNNWNRADFDAIMNILKPFLYGVIDTPDGLGNHIPMPVQHKNSEICALMMYSLVANSLNNSPVYKALSRFMDETVGSDGESLIDMIEFESASKVCNQGVINISFSPKKVKNFIAHGFDTYGIKMDPIKDDNGKIIPVNSNTVETYYSYIKDSLDNMLDKGTITQDKYNEIMSKLAPSEDEIISILKSATTIVDNDGNTVINPQRVKTIPFDYYSESQHVPLHHEDAKVPHGSQARNLAVADISDNTSIELKGKGEKQQFKGQDIVDFYYKLLNENLLEDYFGADGKGGLSEIFSSNESLAEAIKDVVRGNPKYDRGFMEALELHDGKFNLSLNSPTMFSAIQSIVTAFFRNRITKQKVDGATLVQAAGVGLNKDLRLKFDDNGKLIGLECYLPVTSKALFEPLLTTDAEGNTILDPKKLEEFGLNEAVGYRIPTENKSSMAPLIIKGFTPIQNGSVIILPAEITALAGSDFDVDKLFLILSSFSVRNYNMAKAWEDFAKENNIKVNITNSIDISRISDEEFFSYLNEIGFDESFNKWFNRKTGNKTVAGIAIINKDQYLLRDKKTGEPKPEVFAVKYDFNKSPKENGRKARNNMILQITNQILRSKEGSEAFLNPQGFKDVEDAANFMRVLNAFKSGSSEIIDLIPGETYTEKLSNLTKLESKELSALTKKIKNPVAPVYPQTFAKLHAQNMAGVEQLCIYAVQASMSAKHQRANIVIKPYLQFTINGRTIDRIDTSRGGRTVKNTNQMVGAAADNGKNPTLSAMGSTSNTASVIGTLLREGLTHKEAALIVNSPYMQLSKEKLMRLMNGKFPEKNEVTTDMLIRVYVDSNGTNKIASEDDIYNVMALCYKVKSQHTSIEFVNKVSRADSPNGGMKSSYAGCRVQRYKVDVLQAMMGQKTFAFEPIKETLSNDAINMTGSEDEIRKQLYNQRMGLLHGMYALGINSFDTLTKNFFFGSQKWFDDKIIKPILYNLPVDTSDNTLIDIVNSVYKAYVVYRLSDSKLFGNDDQYTMEEKRKYYTEKFPEDFKKLIASNKEVRNLLGNIFTVKMGRIMFLDASNINKKQMAIVRTRVGDLRYSKDEEVRKLATDLLLYSYYENGLQFSNTSISSAFSTDFLMSFKEYSKVLEDMNKEVSEEDTRNFIHQFLSFNHEMAVLVPPSLRDNLMWDKSTGDLLIMNNGKNTIKKMTSPILSPNPNGDINMYKYVIWMGQIYIYDKEATENQGYASLVYHRVPIYSNSKMHPVFNSNLKVSDLESLYSITAKEGRKKEDKDIHDEGLIQEAKNRQGLGKVEDKNMLYDYEDMENEPFNYMDVATQDYNIEDQNTDDLSGKTDISVNPKFDHDLNEDYLENLLKEAGTKTINVDVSDNMSDTSQYSKEGNDTLDTQMCIG